MRDIRVIGLPPYSYDSWASQWVPYAMPASQWVRRVPLCNTQFRKELLSEQANWELVTLSEKEKDKKNSQYNSPIAVNA